MRKFKNCFHFSAIVQVYRSVCECRSDCDLACCCWCVYFIAIYDERANFHTLLVAFAVSFMFATHKKQMLRAFIQDFRHV